MPFATAIALLFAMVSALSVQPQEHKEAAVDKKIFDGLVGRYQMLPNLILNITRDGDDLYAKISGDSAVEIFPESEKEYFAKSLPMTLSFTTDANGTATQVVLRLDAQKITAKRIDGEPQKLKHHTAISVDPKIVARYVGRYQLTDTRIVTITLEDGHVYSEITGRAKFEIFPETEKEFFMKVIELQIAFHADAQGKATELALHEGPRDLTGKRIAGKPDK